MKDNSRSSLSVENNPADPEAPLCFQRGQGTSAEVKD